MASQLVRLYAASMAEMQTTSPATVQSRLRTRYHTYKTTYDNHVLFCNRVDAVLEIHPHVGEVFCYKAGIQQYEKLEGSLSGVTLVTTEAAEHYQHHQHHDNYPTNRQHEHDTNSWGINENCVTDAESACYHK